MSPVTRFAPSPTGHLHLGHAWSAWQAWRRARDGDGDAGGGGRFLLRIEDIDAGRCRPEFEAAIFEDLAWLGLEWERPVLRQSEHFGRYRAALAAIREQGLAYPCFCTRADIRREIEAAAGAPHGPPGSSSDSPAGSPQAPGGGLRYLGTCRGLPVAEIEARIERGEPHAWRLDTAAAVARFGAPTWRDEAAGDVTADPAVFGDVVLARKDVPTSYHLAVTVDDAWQGVTLVVRGEDLFAATHIHCLLQAILGLPTPAYVHHPLLLDADGKRFAKRGRSLTIRSLREQGLLPAEVIVMAENWRRV
ncbi:MAG: tRNA glutamyl-Q(34) synthetase GluQRS [Rhodospirillaceae bacterium]|nr:tRNA glutamyl-Q(34) synthetase GluQRS [Rhodospirillaceae bacterium]